MYHFAIAHFMSIHVVVLMAGTLLALDREIVIDSPWINRDGRNDVQ